MIGLKNFRVTENLTKVILGPGISSSHLLDYNGKWHISSQPLHTWLGPFLVPKASPIQASQIGLNF